MKKYAVYPYTVRKDELFMRSLKKVLAAFISMSMAAVSLTACGGGSSDTGTGSSAASSGTSESYSDTAEAVSYKDHVKVAIPVEPPTLDPHTSGTTACRDVTRYIFEMLFELDSSYDAKPQLCQSYKVKDDYKDFTFTLRQGVKFHNGKEMKAEDVAASLNRWLANTNYAYRVIDGQFTVISTAVLAEQAILTASPNCSRHMILLQILIPLMQRGRNFRSSAQINTLSSNTAIIITAILQAQRLKTSSALWAFHSGARRLPNKNILGK